MGESPLRLLSWGNEQSDMPYWLFLPGMDGTGQLIRRQLPNLQGYFNVRSLSIPTDSELSWSALTTYLAQLIQESCRDRPLYLCGESFGGCLALQLAAYYPDLVDRLILVNSASSFRQRLGLSWGVGVVRALPKLLFQLSAYGLLPFLVNVDRVDLPNQQALLRAMQSVAPNSASWRIQLLAEFDLGRLPLMQANIPTLIIASDRDRLLPSQAEAQRLQAHLPQAQILPLPASGHACLLEHAINLIALLRQQQFLPVSVTPNRPNRQCAPQ